MTVELLPGRHVQIYWTLLARVIWRCCCHLERLHMEQTGGWEIRSHAVTLVKYYTVFTSCRVSLGAWIAQSV